MDPKSDILLQTTGCTWLSPISTFLGVPLDQVNFIMCQMFGLAAASWFRLYLSPQRVGPAVRHAVASFLGSMFIIFSFGWYSLHVFMMSFICYVILHRASVHTVHWYSMIVAMGYLTACQVSRVIIFNYGVLATDFSGPLMMMVQKITTLAFQLHDGKCHKQEELTEEQRRLAVVTPPSLLEYLSYTLNFMSILVGPCSNYRDYTEFIEGHHVHSKLKHNIQQNGYHTHADPSPVRAVCQKLMVCLGCLFWFFTITRRFPISLNVEPGFVNEASFLSRLAYAFISIQASRPKFYFAWTIADAVHNAAGYGISGLDQKGRVSWDLISNIHIWKIETATSFKMFIDNWNIQTGVWLKSVCYDRVPYFRTPLTFMLSALWHGVYPGYYFTFLTGIPITLTARAARRNFRHYFLHSRSVKLVYDVITWAVTQLTICYAVLPFLVLAVEPTVIYYRSMYFYVHIISILGMLIPASRPRRPDLYAQHFNNNVKGE
ncbi:lysophospholipid acyltransferase 1 isoform X1 [Silurus meridionalis]|uniref:Lysophospholipid acyltransferase 1 n=1 Tax=Silurus meridionalis TaxID=175797 RepID=A0A8T0BMS6_SILME|nr:lysophospholipid acyltransferase 1 isoform X1 [Silurus meridionalis]KAF7708378.1 hypothetical protein HF521_017435 [Silurus meridionalis]